MGCRPWEDRGAKLLRFFLLAIAPSILHSCYVVQQAAAMECEDLKRGGIIPEVVPQEACKSLPVQVSIDYGSQTPTKGSAMPVDQAINCPRIRLSHGPSPGQHAVVLMTDPDAPSRHSPFKSEWAHWVASTEMLEIDSASKTYLEYAPPGPPKGSGSHRYVVLVYLGSKAVLTGVPSPSHRMDWGGAGHAHAVAAANGLKLVGADWFTVEVQ